MKLLGTALGVLFAFSFGTTAYAAGISIPFGGTIALITPCVGSGLVVATIIEPAPLPPIQVTAEPSPFLYHLMTHPGQKVLGLMSAPAFCLLDPESGFGIAAPASFFYGTSL